MMAMILEAALRALVLAVAVGLGLRLLSVRNVPARKAAWTVVLVASLAMPLLMRWPTVAGLGQLGWAVPVRVAQPTASQSGAPTPATGMVSEPARGLSAATAPSSSAGRVAIDASAAVGAQMIATEQNSAPPAGKWQWPAPGRLIAMIYFAVSGALLLRLVWGLAVALRLWMHAERVSPLVAPEPNVRASGDVASPVTIGSGIVLPADYVHWDACKLRMVLAHERAHVRGLDFYLQLLAGAYTASFWFSPLGWWLKRALSSLGEAMGDRAGMDAAVSRSDYAQIVLEFAAIPRRSLPGVAMACSGNLSRRVESMLNEGLFRSAFAEGRRRAVLALLLIPAALFAATALIRVPAAQAAQSSVNIAQSTPSTLSSATSSNVLQPGGPTDPPAPASAPTAAPAGVLQAPAAVPPMPEPPADQPETPLAPAVAADPVAANQIGTQVSGDHVVTVEGGSGTSGVVVQDGGRVNGYGYEFSSNGDSWAVVPGAGMKNNFTFTGDWTGELGAEIEKARHMTSGPFLWFTHHGKSYILDDAATVAHIEAMYKPMEELGKRQEELGRQQEALGRQQEELGRQQEQASATVPDLSAQLTELNAAIAKLQAAKGKTMTQQELADVQGKVAELQGKLGDLQGEAGAKEGVLGEQQGRLGEQQGKLGEQQGRLGEEQGRLATEANRQVRSIIDEALRKGTAKPVK